MTQDSPDPNPASGAPAAGLLRRALAAPEMGVFILLVVCTVAFGLLDPAQFSYAGVRAMLRAASLVGIIAVGQTLLLVAGEIDLSVGAVGGLCAIVASSLMAHGAWPAAAAVMAGLGVGAAAGLANGLVAVLLGVPAFLATLGTFYVAGGLSRLACGGNSIGPLPAAVAHLGSAEPLRASWGIVLFAAIALAGECVLRRTVFGRMVYATGGNAEVARMAGIPTRGVKLACYVATGALAALAGILAMAEMNAGDPSIGKEWELQVLAGVLVGGVSLYGGAGGVVGAVLGLLLMQVVYSGLAAAGIGAPWQTIAAGALMTAGVSVDVLRRRARILIKGC